MDTVVAIWRALPQYHFTEPEVAELTQAVAEVHFFNPLTGGLGADAQPQVHASPWDLPTGRSIRNFWL